MATEFTVKVADRPGQLAAIAAALGEAGVNMRSVAASKGTIGILVSDADTAKARRALKNAKYRATERKAIEVRLKDKPGALARSANRLGKGKVNITPSGNVEVMALNSTDPSVEVDGERARRGELQSPALVLPGSRECRKARHRAHRQSAAIAALHAII